MNIKKIKMALTIGLMKNRDSNQSLQGLKELMNTLREDVGNFLGLQQLDQQLLNANHVQQRYALQFERCTLNVDLIANPTTKTQVIKSFNVR
jgi:hypothetical protein